LAARRRDWRGAIELPRCSRFVEPRSVKSNSTVRLFSARNEWPAVRSLKGKSSFFCIGPGKIVVIFEPTPPLCRGKAPKNSCCKRPSKENGIRAHFRQRERFFLIFGPPLRGGLKAFS
jgi:hypothetical protein